MWFLHVMELVMLCKTSDQSSVLRSFGRFSIFMEMCCIIRQNATHQQLESNLKRHIGSQLNPTCVLYSASTWQMATAVATACYNGWDRCEWLQVQYRSQRWSGCRGEASSAWGQNVTVGLPTGPAASFPVPFAPALELCLGTGWWSLAWTSAVPPDKKRNMLILLTYTNSHSPALRI